MIVKNKNPKNNEFIYSIPVKICHLIIFDSVWKGEVLAVCPKPKPPESVTLPFGSKKTSDPKITSTGGRESSWGDILPQVMPRTGTWGRAFIRQLRRQFSRHWGSSSLSDSSTSAPHLAATIPGRLTPAPSWKERGRRGVP